MHVTVQRTGVEDEVLLSGRLDGRSAGDVRERCTRCSRPARDGPILDLPASSCSTRPVSASLVGAHRPARLTGRDMVLRGAPIRVARLLPAARLDRVITLEPAAASRRRPDRVAPACTLEPADRLASGPRRGLGAAIIAGWPRTGCGPGELPARLGLRGRSGRRTPRRPQRVRGRRDRRGPVTRSRYQAVRRSPPARRGAAATRGARSAIRRAGPAAHVQTPYAR